MVCGRSLWILAKGINFAAFFLKRRIILIFPEYGLIDHPEGHLRESIVIKIPKDKRVLPAIPEIRIPK